MLKEFIGKLNARFRQLALRFTALRLEADPSATQYETVFTPFHIIYPCLLILLVLLFHPRFPRAQAAQSPGSQIINETYIYESLPPIPTRLPVLPPPPEPAPSAVPEPDPLPVWGAYDSHTYRTLAAVIYLEAGAGMSLESGCAVGWVVRNRSESAIWGNTSIVSQIYRARQFSVVGAAGTNQRRYFNSLVDKMETMQNKGAENAQMAAQMVLQGSIEYRLPSHVMYFHGEESRRKWGRHIFYREIGGNAFFSDRRAVGES